MNKPLDFTTTEAPPASPPPRRTTPFPWRGIVVVLVVVGLAALGWSLLFGNDDDGGPHDAESAASVARFCALADDVDRAIDQAAPATAAADASQVLRQVTGSLAELQATAPDGLGSQVRAIVDDVEKASGGESAVLGSPDFERRRAAFAVARGSFCSAGVGSGE